jgi:hypothetical protein
VNLSLRKPYLLWTAAWALIGVILVVAAWAWLHARAAAPREAPEAARVLQTQSSLPFQILIPAYLPAGFDRDEVSISTEDTGPQGQVMARLVYTHPLGVNLTLYEWQPGADFDGSLKPDYSPVSGAGPKRCTCMCAKSGQCSQDQVMIDNGPLRVMGETTDASILSPEHVRVILTTLGPAGGLLTYSSLKEVPIAAGLPPPEPAPVNASGVQEVVLVVSPSGYSPVHFSVQKGIPVRLTFKQLGEVGCGNELYFPWGAQQSDILVLEKPADTQVLEFTPQESGEFLFHCSHYYFQGVMTVTE